MLGILQIHAVEPGLFNLTSRKINHEEPGTQPPTSFKKPRWF